MSLNGHETVEVFAERIREHYSEGLTGIFTIGATRRTYILEHQRSQIDNLGRIDDFEKMGAYLLERYLSFCEMFFTLGGQNMIVTALSYRGFFERGSEYAEKVGGELLRLASGKSIEFYRSHNIDPYFIGLEPLLHQPKDSPMHQTGTKLQAFMADWPYQEGRRKLLWEVASIPLLSFWQVFTRLDETARRELDIKLASTTDISALQRILYEFFSKATLGTNLPMPHFYLGNNMSGDLKWRAPMPLALSAGEYIRAYYTPYPLLFLTLEGFKGIIEDLAFGKRLHAPQAYDYAGLYTPEVIQAEYERILTLTANPESILGLVRKISP